jgi:uncharacterized tellurite resistance protein B-like protein
MFDRFIRPAGQAKQAGQPATPPAADQAAAAGETATVRRIVARLEAMPPDQARLLASAAYTVARAANADLDISDAETAAMEREFQAAKGIDEATAVLVVEMAKLQARTIGGSEDYSVTREFGKLASHDQKLAVLRACFVVAAEDGTISADEASVVNEIARELDIESDELNRVRADFHDRLSAVQELRRLQGNA